MARAMQLLLPGADGKPGPSLRPAFAAAAIREAEHWWLGDAAEFRAIVEGATAPSYSGDWRTRAVFRDFTTAPRDHARFAGAMHIRTLAPRLECRRNLYRNAGAGPGRLDTIIPRGNIATPNARGRGLER